MEEKNQGMFVSNMQQLHIDVLMLCRKFEPIPNRIFRVMSIFNCSKFSEWLQNYPKFLLHFLIHIDVLMQGSKTILGY